PGLPRQHALGRFHVVVQAGEWILDDRDLVAALREDLVDGQPRAAVDPGPMNEDDVLHADVIHHAASLPIQSPRLSSRSPCCWRPCLLNATRQSKGKNGTR